MRRPHLRRALRRLRARLAAPGPVIVRFEGDAGVLGEGEVAPGRTLLEAAERLSVDLDHFCGGQGKCGTCRVEVLAGAEALPRATGRERAVLGDAAFRAGSRLACQATPRGAVTVRVPARF